VSDDRALIVPYHAICEHPPPLCQALDEQLELLAAAGFRATAGSMSLDRCRIAPFHSQNEDPAK
jgi:hypothetical protein